MGSTVCHAAGWTSTGGRRMVCVSGGGLFLSILICLQQISELLSSTCYSEITLTTRISLNRPIDLSHILELHGIQSTSDLLFFIVHCFFVSFLFYR